MEFKISGGNKDAKIYIENEKTTSPPGEFSPGAGITNRARVP